MKKNKVFNSFKKDIPFEPNYVDIKNNIEMDQYTTKETIEKKRFFQPRFASILALLILFTGIAFGTMYSFGELKIKYVDQSNVLIYKHDKEFIDNFDYIFVGKVREEVQTKQYDGTGMDLPYTLFGVEQVHILKGEKDNSNNLLCFIGGHKNKKELELLKNNNELIEVGRYYLFFANKNDDPSSRIGLNNYILSDNIQKILLEEYEDNKEITEQKQNILTTINRYKNIIDRTLGNEMLKIEQYQEKKDLYNAFDYVSIIKVNNFISVDTKGNGVHSEIVSSYYSVEVLMNFKKETNATKKNLYCYGTDFWNNEKEYSHFVDLLKEGSVYLLLANECLNNESNTRLNLGDFEVMDNYQLVELKDYQIEKNYEKQKDEIKRIINEYIK